MHRALLRNVANKGLSLPRTAKPTTSNQQCHNCTNNSGHSSFSRSLTSSSSPLRHHILPIPIRPYLPSVYHSSSSFQFSTSSIRKAISSLNLDDLDVMEDMDDATTTTSKQRMVKSPQKIISSRPPASISDATSKNNNLNEDNKDTNDNDNEASRFFDPSIPAADPILQFRAMYDKVRYSKQPEDQEAFLRMYRAIADDPQLLQQLQPKDFMVALNSTRDLLHVIPRMQRIIQDVERTKHRSVPEIYHILLKHYTKLSDFKHCRDLLKRMTQAGIDFNLHTYHIMLSICKHERQLRRATFILEEIRAKKIEITESTYLMMMSVCVACKNPRKAREYFEEMPLIGLEQQLSHYNTLLNAYVHAKDLEGARNVFSEMEENDEITPDSYSYAAMIKILKSPKYHRPTEAEELVKTMERRGLKPNARVLMALQVNPLKVQQTCEATGVELTVQDYNLLIGTSIRQNQFQDIPALFTAMSNQGLRPDMVTFTMMVDANLKMNKYPEAKEIFWAMQQANIQPDVVAYSALMTGALLQSKVLESLEILKRMLNDGMLPNLLTFNSLLSASVGEIDVKGFKMIRETMDALKIRPDNRSFNALLSAYALKGDIQEMMCTLDDMRRSNVFPDALTYSVLISGFLRNGDLRFAVDWYFKMQESGMKPATTVVNNLMAALHGSSEGQKVLMLFHDMGDRMIRKDERTYEIVLDTCTKFNLHSSRHAIEEEFKEYLANQSLKEDMIKRKNIKN